MILALQISLIIFMFSESVNFFSLFFFFVCVGSAFFRDDTRLRALRFLDHMLVWLTFSHWW